MKLYEKVIKNPWPYWVGGILLGILNILLLFLTGSTWKITTGFLYWGAVVLEKIGLNPADWYYYSTYDHGLKEGQTFFLNSYTVLNIAVIVGALLAVLWAKEFKWKKIKNFKQFSFALLGGILMGYGTRLSFGCNIGAYFSAIPSFSLQGWVFAAFMFVGAWIGSKILFKYIL
ncbi:YeeE/YedE thiosulfate transporter family protein [Alkaliphilus transvaalensis]|uniref:YeeE/YedE thiosulfate transporter family protein n=1 Tax=Alkaliphilus transvaalensis TaxID=114628 RepID=UPI000478EF17|nr:YeeE/YedE thiosulfate transporter family protein [Alkaliphilus transvaalensis]